MDQEELGWVVRYRVNEVTYSHVVRDSEKDAECDKSALEYYFWYRGGAEIWVERAPKPSRLSRTESTEQRKDPTCTKELNRIISNLPGKS